MMQYAVNIVLLFFIFSCAGWCMEVALKYRQYHRFINRGFMIGPFLPIYGSGVVLITLAFRFLKVYDNSVGMIFMISFFICGAAEYLTSYFMEKRFHARWWDYSQKPMNLNGRVWIGNLILFGLAGVVIVKFADPFVFAQLNRINYNARLIIACVLLAVFATDYTVSHFVMKLVKQGVESSEADNTEQISREINMLMHNRSVFHRRFAEAYPEVIYKTDRIAARMESIREETERLRRQAEMKADELSQHLGDLKEQITEDLEPTYLIKNTIIQKQDELITLLYDESKASQQEIQLMTEIGEKKKQIEDRRSLRKTLTRRFEEHGSEN